MPDTPDYSKYLPGSTRFSVADLGEMAARLGSPVTFDRRGEVVWMDVGDKGLAPYSVSGSGTGNSVRVNVLRPLHGCYVLQMTAGSDASALSQLVYRLSNVSMLRFGLEVAWYMVSPFTSVMISLFRYTGTQCLRADMRILYAGYLLQCYVMGTGWTTFGSVGKPDDPYGIYHHMKMVADFDAGYHMRALYDDQEYDLSAYELYKVANSEAAHYVLVVSLYGRATFNDEAYVGHVIVTGNES